MTALGVNVWDATMRERVETLQWSLAKELLLIGNTVILEWGTWTRAERDALRLGAREVGAAVHLIYLDVPDEELWRRIQGRDMEDPPIRPADIDRWRRQFQAPDQQELGLYDASPSSS